MKIGNSFRGKWLQVDPLRDKYAGWSGYNYVEDNPINKFDNDGRKTWTFNIAKDLFEISYGLGVGGSLSWVWDDKGNAGLLWTINVGAVGNGAIGFGIGGAQTNAETIYDLRGIGYSLGAYAGEGYGLSYDKEGDLFGNYSSNFSFNVGLISGYSPYATLTVSNLLLSGKAVEFNDMITHIKNGGRFKIDLGTRSVILLDKNDKVIEKVKFEDDDRIIPKLDYKSKNGYYFMSPDATKVNYNNFLYNSQTNYDVSSMDGR